MTEGIIQEVFNDWKQYKIKEGILECIEYELIEKIKTKQFRVTYKHPDKVVKLKDLIGDNQE